MTAAQAVVAFPHIPEVIDIHREAHYWRWQYHSARERLESWKQKGLALEERLRVQGRELQELRGQRESDQARISWLEKQVFGQKTEQGRSGVGSGVETSVEAAKNPIPDGAIAADKKKRGQQEGKPGHGRRRRTELPVEEIPYRFERPVCPRCGRALEIFPGTEDSDEIHWEVRVVRRVHRRERYQASCDCGVLPGIVTAPGPQKLIAKGLFSTEFWVRLLMEKYLFQRPLNRVLQVLALEGLQVSGGTLTGGLQALAPLLEPVYEAIKIYSLRFNCRKMDETRWPVFVLYEGKKGTRWWMWIDVTVETVVYVLDPTRSTKVLTNHLGDWEGILLVDCYSAYQSHQAQIGLRGLKLILAFCWAHRRRDFIEVQEGYPRLRSWAETWIHEIDDLFALNAKRVKVLADPAAFAVEQTRLKTAIEAMTARRTQELTDPALHPAARKVLQCQARHWAGLIVFVDHPEIPMDNNESERLQRPNAVGRKNYYGSGAVWSGHFSAHAFTIFQTLLRNHIDPYRWFLGYFTACAQNGGKPLKRVDAFLPWNISQEQKAAWLYPRSERSHRTTSAACALSP